MKLKQQPDDFYVEELTDVVPGEGVCALYRLEKRSWTTPDAIAAIRRRWKIDHRRVSYGGLKDRHAHTIQYLTIFHGPWRNLKHQSIRLEYLGQVAEPYTSEAIRANRFRIVLRSLSQNEIPKIESALEEVRADGVPNYFDDQRFGSASGGEFVARLIVLGRYEDALRTALTAPYEFDRAEQKRGKTHLQSYWGDWPACQAALPRGHHARKLLDYLVNQPDDFRGALARLRPELRGLYLSAYQSHLWNRMLARWLAEHLPPDQLGTLQLRLANVPVHRLCDDAQRHMLAETRLPLPSPRIRLDSSDPPAVLMASSLAEDGITIEQMKLEGLREMFFSKGDRAVLCMPVALHAELGDDELNSGRMRLRLAFDLPRGCYATLIVKRITTAQFSN